MEITFKDEQKQKQTPFLQRFKYKINRIDRISGLLGALGIQYPATNKQKTFSRKAKSQNHSQHHNSDPQNTKQTMKTSRVVTQISVKRFKTQIDEQCCNKQNKDINIVMQRVNHCSKFGKRKLFLKIAGNDTNLRQKQMNILILPKIAKPINYASQGGSRIKQKLQNKKKFFLYKIATEKRENELKKDTVIR